MKKIAHMGNVLIALEMMRTIPHHTPFVEPPRVKPIRIPKETKSCKYSQCGKSHNHNNACCSAEHYKLWHEEQRTSNQ